MSFTSECPDWVFVKDDLYVTSFQYRQDRGKLAGEGVQCNPSWSLPVEPNLLATPPLPPYPSLPSFPSNVYTYTLHIERFHWASLHAHTYIDTNLLGRTSLYLFLLMLSGVLATNWVPALSLEICCSRCGRHKALRHPRESFPYTSTTQANKSKALSEKCRS